MLTLKIQRRGETYVHRDGKYLGSWLGENADIRRLVELANEDEERRLAREGIVIENPDQATLPLPEKEVEPNAATGEPVKDALFDPASEEVGS